MLVISFLLYFFFSCSLDHLYGGEGKREGGNEKTHFSFTTMTMPAWQCLPWEQ